MAIEEQPQPVAEPSSVVSAKAATEAHISLPTTGLESFFGTHDQNLKRLERAFGVEMSARGSELHISGEPGSVEAMETMMGEFGALLETGFRFSQEDIRTAIRVKHQAPDMPLVDFFLPSEPALAAVRKLIAPRSFNQYRYLKAMLENDMVLSIGPAGTGKTFLAVAMAAAALLEKRIKRIVLARPAVEAGEKLGFLPGDLAEKINPYLRPLYDSLYDLLGYERVGRLLERGIIEVAPLAFMRGRTLNDSFVIMDEAQNTTSEQMKMFLTRLGFGSKAVINGDATQIDLPSRTASGLREAEQVLKGVRGVGFLYFEREDVVRHPLVQRIVAAYENYEIDREARPSGSYQGS